tara:strand:- start:1003 stop:1377 length:375 start_codon:yes stop_codon:yes gene_type:complete
MALTAKEKAMINALVENQIRLEQMLANQAHPLAGLGYRVSAADPLNSPLVFSSAEKKRISRRAAAAGKRAGSKTRRKVSRYQREFGKNLKRLKKKHPRTNISTLMKRSHRDTKRSLKIRVPRRK